MSVIPYYTLLQQKLTLISYFYDELLVALLIRISKVPLGLNQFTCETELIKFEVKVRFAHLQFLLFLKHVLHRLLQR